MRVIVAVALWGLLTSQSGCFLFRARADLAELDRASSLAGNLVVLGDAHTPVVVNLIRRIGPEEWRPEQQWVRYGSGPFACVAGEGEFILLAWEDLNQDLVFQPGENVGWHGGQQPELLQLVSGSDRKGLRIQLRTPEDAGERLPDLYRDAKVHQPFALVNDNDGEIVAIDDPRLRDEVGSIGMWEPARFCREGHHGVFFVEAYDSTKIPVLFVHGINGSGSDWQFLIENLDRVRFQPWVAQYPSGMRLDLVADYVRRAMVKLRVRFQFSHLLVVAHSMGGLVSRGVLNRHIESCGDEGPWIRLLVTFSSPFGGHDSARSGVRYSPAVVPAWYDMVPESDFLATLFDQQLPDELPHHLAFGFRGAGSWIRSENNDGVVTIKSQLRPEAQASAESVTGFDEDHVGILSSSESSRYLNARLRAAADLLSRDR